MVDRQALGRWGEDLAVRHLEAEGAMVQNGAMDDLVESMSAAL